jgi:hypothetical protein
MSHEFVCRKGNHFPNSNVLDPSKARQLLEGQANPLFRLRSFSRPEDFTNVWRTEANRFCRRLVEGRRDNIVAAVKVLSVGKLTGTRTADSIESGLSLGSSCSTR